MIFLKKKVNKIKHNCVNDIIFIHIPKNAGTSVAKSLGISSTTHAKAFEIYRDYGRGYLKDKFVFTLVRDPIDRFISLYNYSRMEVSQYHNNLSPDEALYGRHLDYDILKGASIQDCVSLLVNKKLKHDLTWNQWEPQYTWIYDEKRNKQLVDKIYKIENIVELQKDFMENFGLEISISKHNASKKQANVIIDSKSKGILEEFYKKDFQLLNY